MIGAGASFKSSVLVMILLAAFAAAFAIPAIASSVAAEEADGARVLREIKAGDRSCAEVSASEFDHVGEYAMGRVLGSTAAHEAMNERMTRMMGEAGETRMHVLMGRRYAGCGGPVLPARFGQMMGVTGMMAGLGGSRGSMMGGAGMMEGRSWGNHHDDNDVSAGWIVAGVVILVGATGAAFLAGRRTRGER